MNSLFNEITETELLDLNEKFHCKKLLPEEFYNQLINKEIAYKNSFLISIFPDGNETYCGLIITQDKQIFEFDLDLRDSKYSNWINKTEDFQQKIAKNKKSKEAIALSLIERMA
ncbi:hypothetical protein ACSV5M_02345 [Cellvibrio sp. ARAG 10.3]|uniref:hypothetical protein n=1 Tax=Cellvibrio sp. ARAG 10.3 TaxID=3451358 RepID=UPI003F470097